MTPSDWEKAKTEYIKGNATLKEIAEKYGISHSHIRAKASKEKWSELQYKHHTKKAEQIVRNVRQGDVKKASSIQLCADGMIDIIAKHIATGELDPDSIAKLTRSLKDLREIKHDLTEYELREQSLRLSILEKQAKADEVKDTEMTIKFVNMPWDKEGEGNA